MMTEPQPSPRATRCHAPRPRAIACPRPGSETCRTLRRPSTWGHPLFERIRKMGRKGMIGQHSSEFNTSADKILGIQGRAIPDPPGWFFWLPADDLGSFHAAIGLV